MKTLGIRSFGLAFLLTASAFAQVTISRGGVVNAATFAIPGLPNSGIAQGSIFTIFGNNLGPDPAEFGFSFPLPTLTPGGKVSVNVTVDGTTSNAIILYSGKTQINAVMPSSMPVGTGTVSVSFNGEASATEPVQVVKSNFGSFSLNSSGTGPGIVTFADNSLVGAKNAANPGETLVVWGTGLGPVAGVENAGPLPGDQSSVPIEVFVGSSSATVTYRGRSGCCAGLDQIVFVVPPAIQGCAVPVAVKIGNFVSNFTTIAVAQTSRTCSAPETGLSDATFTPLAGKADASFAMISLGRTTMTTPGLPGAPAKTTTTDSGFAVFEKVSIPAGTGYSPALFNTVSFGACVVSTFNSATMSATTPTGVGAKIAALDAGASLTIAGPSGNRALTPIAAADPGFYSAILGDGTPGNYLDPGQYNVAGAGGKEVGAFSTRLNLPPALTWTNADSVDTINRPAGQLITWSGGDSTTNVSIDGSSFTVAGTDAIGAVFHCQARASDGRFTIPAVVLLSLPPTANNIPGSAAPMSRLSVGETTPYTTFTAPGLDLGVITGSSSTSKPVSYQ